MLNILSFAASSSKKSINKQVVKYCSNVIHDDILPDANVEIIDLNDFEMAIYSQDYEEAHGIPNEAKKLFNKIAQADALLISFAEHNGYYTAAYKNIFDWMSRVDRKVFQDKKMIILSVSIGPGGGKNVLKIATESAPFFGAETIGSYSIGNFNEVFDVEKGKFNDQELVSKLHDV
ncbi:MAG: NAD(P)H-dependent oxidoreductase, partial [Pseudomonadota bacterium]